MRLESLLLADHAVAAPDGKLYINGGGITRLSPPSVPFAIPFLSVVLRFEVSKSDGGEHSLLIRLRDPQGVDLLPLDPREIPVTVPPVPGDEETYLQLVLSFGGLPLLTFGTHALIIELDGRPVREMKLPVVPGPVDGGESSPPAESETLLS